MFNTAASLDCRRVYATLHLLTPCLLFLAVFLTSIAVFISFPTFFFFFAAIMSHSDVYQHQHHDNNKSTAPSQQLLWTPQLPSLSIRRPSTLPSEGCCSALSPVSNEVSMMDEDHDECSTPRGHNIVITRPPTAPQGPTPLPPQTVPLLF